MKEYDDSFPLIAIHIPKTAGVSVREIYKEWFGNGFLRHYKNINGLPEKYKLSTMHSKECPVVVYGHFNQCRGFGVEQYYPGVKQFVTILRDPFERAVSRYFYFNRNLQTSQEELIEVLLNQKPEWSMLCHFPKKITKNNYKSVIEDSFVEVGVMEFLDESLRRISVKLDRVYNAGLLNKLNASKRNLAIPYELKSRFMEINALEYLVYNYALEKYN